ncbi:MAG: cobaltochelatase subunit CobS [Magnetococcales bacterium]|nr:cobaltochelatase subunit CobS [Magnetococcales bacterium]|tara:strand:- start:436219 stop:437190 length:972 start_codon:yes stop_codon:yes gene_type:complete
MTNTTTDPKTDVAPQLKKFKVSEVFGFESTQTVTGFEEPSDFVPEVDPTYQFDKQTTEVLLAGFENNLRVLVQGYHGTGKSTHIEQIAARLNWPCFRLNLDGHISRLDLVGRDAIVIKDGKQITTFREGILPWALQRPMALVLDEYDAGRPEVMFAIQRLLEKDGVLALPEQNRIVNPHKHFRLFGTANTVGLGDATGMYHGTNQLNQAQMDRWNMVVRLNYLEEEKEADIVMSKAAEFHNRRDLVLKMVRLANLTRTGFMAGDIATVMSPRTVLMWAENAQIFGDIFEAYKLTFMNRADVEDEQTLIEYFQRVFGTTEGITL